MKKPWEEIKKYETQYPSEPLALFIHKSTAGGIGGMSLLLLRGIVATDISHSKAGRESGRKVACCPVANHLPQFETGEQAILHTPCSCSLKALW